MSSVEAEEEGKDRNGVGILVDGDLREQVVEVRRINDRLIIVKLVIGGLDLDEEAKKLFYEDLDEVVRGIPNTEKIVIGGDFNSHIRATSNGFDDVHGGFGFGERNGGGTSLLDFAKAFELVIANFMLSEEGEPPVTFVASGDRGLVGPQGYPSENLTTQHKLLVMDLEIKRARRKKIASDRPRIKWGGLTPALSREMGEKLIGMGAWSGSSDTDVMWKKAANCIREVASKVLGISRGNFGGHKGDWWWNGEVQGKVEAKKAAYNEWVECVDEEVKRELKKVYKTTKTEAKRLSNADDEFGDTGGDKKLYRLAKARERKARDLDQVKCIKDEEGKVLVDEISIKQRTSRLWVRCFRIEEVIRAISRMSRGRATGPDEIPVDFWKSADKAGIEWLTRLFNVIFKTAKMPDEWRWSTMVPLYKNKGDIQNCNNYRGIKLLSHTMKIWERVVEMRAYDKVPRNVLWRCLEARGVTMIYIRAIKDICGGAKTSKLERHALSPFLFALVMDELTRSYSGGGPMVCLIDETQRRVNREVGGVETSVGVQRVQLSRTKRIFERESFKYLGVVIQGSGDIDEDVTHRGVAWMKWRLASDGVLASQKRTCPKNACCRDEDVEMDERGYPEKVGVASVVDSSRKARPIWFGHVKKRSRQARRGRGKPKKYWGEVIRQDLAQLHLTEDMTLERKEWRSRINVEGLGDRVSSSLSLARVVLVCDTYSLMLFTELPTIFH
ncbi:hypothetical protein H5410_020262 [Solanum commersonii]|uniref:Uncharacterized protein n=1 Tax=Solanum commersonii TaxID=4109 RepID=A0A9J5Z9K8_SOLCO|nr:hypothetical protein H5410_020262 [Solanum commersonii]